MGIITVFVITQGCCEDYMNIYVAISVQYIFAYYEDTASMITELKTCVE